MSTAVRIRNAVPADAAVIADFNERLAWETEEKRLAPQVVAEGVARLLADAALGRYFVACQGDRIVGQLMITQEWSDWRNGPMWWIQSVYVLAEFRGQGIFRQLHDHALVAAKAAGAVGLRLYVERENARAIKAYEAAGMKDAHYLVYEQMFHGGSGD